MERKVLERLSARFSVRQPAITKAIDVADVLVELSQGRPELDIHMSFQGDLIFWREEGQWFSWSNRTKEILALHPKAAAARPVTAVLATLARLDYR